MPFSAVLSTNRETLHILGLPSNYHGFAKKLTAQLDNQNPPDVAYSDGTTGYRRRRTGTHYGPGTSGRSRSYPQPYRLLHLPEAADWSLAPSGARRDALPFPGRYADFLAGLAKRFKCWISAGCLEKERNQVYNSAVIIDRAGRLLLKHRKIDTLPWLTRNFMRLGQPRISRYWIPSLA